MADALDSVDDGGRALIEAARRRGRRLHADRATDPAPAPAEGLAAAAAELERCGYEPYPADGCLRLRNCPFHLIAAEHRDLVCSMNLALLEGVFGTGPEASVRLQLEPADGECWSRSAPTAEPVRGPRPGPTRVAHPPLVCNYDGKAGI